MLILSSFTVHRNSSREPEDMKQSELFPPEMCASQSKSILNITFTPLLTGFHERKVLRTVALFMWDEEGLHKILDGERECLLIVVRRQASGNEKEIAFRSPASWRNQH
jgi:hypothetical protein